MSPILSTLQKRQAVATNNENTALWADVEKVAKELDAVNFGQGYPDFPPPDFVTSALQSLVKDESKSHFHQYTRSWGHPRLVKILATIYSEELNQDLNPNTNVLITAGASQSIYCSIDALIKTGDEVILFQPFYDGHECIVKRHGGVSVFVDFKFNKDNNRIYNKELNEVPGCSDENQSSTNMDYMSTKNLTFDEEDLASKFTKKTKLFILNSPNNPLGKVFSMDELKIISKLCIKHNVRVISDEVYERTVFPPNKHISISSLPGMWERTIKIANAGKSLCVTGWKIGWCIGPADLIKEVATSHEHVVYTCATILQEAVAISLEQEFSSRKDKTSHFNSLPNQMMPKVKQVCDMVSKVGMIPIVPEGGYFVVADISKIDFKEAKNNVSRDMQFIRWLLLEKVSVHKKMILKIAVLPLCIFYDINRKDEMSQNFIRICHFKKKETLDRAQKIFEEWDQSLVSPP